ncbi:proteasome subunit beta type-1-like [Actinidia eriantha]|uniref:proteasome subunit beta type-1-like n=1 Tax=Actinidia eriantha TaxID=165200 RepID=UPI00258B502A|nr:proteasome subunit beta type-1-like [Actinidia eriantha]XP_057500751.1 proteasome subunit beta type-1-like [Actinidia eriantha]
MKQQSNWSPYDNNGGTCVAIAGADYCVIAADTRMSTGYSILTRDYSKICQLYALLLISFIHCVSRMCVDQYLQVLPIILNFLFFKDVVLDELYK